MIFYLLTGNPPTLTEHPTHKLAIAALNAALVADPELRDVRLLCGTEVPVAIEQPPPLYPTARLAGPIPRKRKPRDPAAPFGFEADGTTPRAPHGWLEEHGKRRPKQTPGKQRAKEGAPTLPAVAGASRPVPLPSRPTPQIEPLPAVPPPVVTVIHGELRPAERRALRATEVAPGHGQGMRIEMPDGAVVRGRDNG